MTQHISPNQNDAPVAGAARSKDSALNDEAVRERRRQERRRLLLGSAAGAGAIVTMANRPAFAWSGGGGGGGQCTVSALGSLHPSRPVSGSCGDSPGCWKNHDSGCWADGAIFNGVPVKYTHSTLITKCFPILSGSPYTVSSGTLWNMINQGGGTFSIKLANGSHYSILTGPGQQLNIAAAILNNYFYGSLYSTSDIMTVISNAFSSCKTYAGSNDTTSISNTLNQLCNTLDTMNNQGETCGL